MIRTPGQFATAAFPFGPQFQQMLLKLILSEDVLNVALVEYLKPEYFTQPPLSWAYGYALRYRSKYGKMPDLAVILEETRRLDKALQPPYQALLEQVRTQGLSDEAWVRDQTIEFIRRNIFVAAFHQARETFNGGRTEQAYDDLMRALETMGSIYWDDLDRGFFMETLAERTERRLRRAEQGHDIPTGFGAVDQVLDGGLSLGELGAWVAYAKVGKTTMLTNLGISAIKIAWKQVLHLVFEGGRAETEDRYEAAFLEEKYRAVRRGDIDFDKFRQAQDEYETLARKLVIRGFTEHWDYNVSHIDTELTDLKKRFGWTPSMIVVDYGDLLSGRNGPYKNQYDAQTAAFRDIKTLATRGYAVWTGSQAQRPSKNADVNQHLLKARDIADCYGKVRVCDFIGSLNQTLDERQAGVMRLYAELYRNGEPKVAPIQINSNFSTMRFSDMSEDQTVQPTPQVPAVPVHKEPTINYGQGDLGF